jgi:hypothetical protein
MFTLAKGCYELYVHHFRKFAFTYVSYVLLQADESKSQSQYNQIEHHTFSKSLNLLGDMLLRDLDKIMRQ